MQTVEENTKNRLAEVGLYLKFVKELEKSPSVTAVRFPSAAQSAPVLKASTFLLLYNVIESCVRSALGQTYEEMVLRGAIFDSSTDRIRELWIKQQLDVPTDTANHQTYISIATRVAKSVSECQQLSLEARKLPISGNLNGDSIRSICAKHGIDLKVSRWAKGGTELETIKEQRNALAHGYKSFSECGREYGVGDLERISKQTGHFLKGFIQSVATYNSRAGYKRP